MCNRILTLMIACLMVSACAHGVKRMPVELMKPDLTIPPAQLAQCPELPQPASGKRSDLLRNHVEVARMYHECRADHMALVCTVIDVTGVTVNGGHVKAPEWCDVSH